MSVFPGCFLKCLPPRNDLRLGTETEEVTPFFHDRLSAPASLCVHDDVAYDVTKDNEGIADKNIKLVERSRNPARMVTIGPSMMAKGKRMTYRYARSQAMTVAVVMVMESFYERIFFDCLGNLIECFFEDRGIGLRDLAQNECLSFFSHPFVLWANADADAREFVRAERGDGR